MLDDMIQAYALGCINTEETLRIRKSAAEDPGFSFKELGKYQNLAALLPCALSLETPDEKVKEKLARKLYRIKNEPGFKKKQEETVPSRDIAKEIIHRSVTADSSAERYVRITGQTKPTHGDVKKSRDFSDIRLEPVGFKKPKKNIYFILAALFVGFCIGFILFYENKDVFMEEIQKLTTENESLNSELMVHNGLMTLLEKRDTKIYSLTGTETFPDGSGKIFVNSSSNRAYIYITGLPELNETKIYQLWIVTAGTAYPSGLFNTGSGSSYYYFTFPRIDYDKKVTFMISEEPAGGSEKPGRKLLLMTAD